MRLALFACLPLLACGGSAAPAVTPPPADLVASDAGAAVAPTAEPAPSASPAAPLPGQVGIVDTKIGTGALVQAGDQISMHYTGTFTDGRVFDSSRTRGEPFQYRFGAGQVIKGWELGIAGMRVGGRRILTIPPELGYGSRGAREVIPPDTTLIFDVELVSIP